MVSSGPFLSSVLVLSNNSNINTFLIHDSKYSRTAQSPDHCHSWSLSQRRGPKHQQRPRQWERKVETECTANTHHALGPLDGCCLTNRPQYTGQGETKGRTGHADGEVAVLISKETALDKERSTVPAKS